MKISFDPDKDEKTRRERGFSLVMGKTVIENAAFSFLDDRFDYSEDRFVTFGYVGERLHVCVFTMRDGTHHIISLRKANERELKKYGR